MQTHACLTVNPKHYQEREGKISATHFDQSSEDLCHAHDLIVMLKCLLFRLVAVMAEGDFLALKVCSAWSSFLLLALWLHGGAGLLQRRTFVENPDRRKRSMAVFISDDRSLWRSVVV